MGIDGIFILFLYIAALLFVLMIQRKYYHSFRNPVSFFSLIWVIVGFFANTPIMGFYSPSPLVNACILIGVFIFTIVYGLLVKPYVFNDLTNDDYVGFTFADNLVVNYRLTYILLAIGFLFLIPKMIVAVNVSQSYGLAYLRDNLGNADAGLSSGGVLDHLYGYFVEPVFTAASIFSCVLLYSKENRKRVYTLFIVSFVSLVCCSVAEASRAGIMKFLFCLIFTTMICNRKILKTIFHYRLIRYGITGMVIIVVAVSLGRSNASGVTDFNYLETFYIYYFSGPAYMTALLDANPAYGIGGINLYGQATFGFLTNIISLFNSFVFNVRSGSLYLLGSVLTNVGYKIAPNHRVNAMCTCFYDFLLDWSYAGIIIGPIILAIASSAITKSLYGKRTYFSCSLYVLWLYTLVRTVFKLDTVSLYFLCTIVYLKLFSKKISW